MLRWERLMPDQAGDETGETRQSRHASLRWFASHPRLSAVLFLGSVAASQYFWVCQGLAITDPRLMPVKVAEILGFVALFAVVEQQIIGKSTWFKIGCFVVAWIFLRVSNDAVHAMLTSACTG